MSPNRQLLDEVIRKLDDAGIPHMLVGSLASMTHGADRLTQDIDIVIDPTPESLTRFIATLDRERVYVDSGYAQQSLAVRDQFNIIEFGSGWKIDLIIRKERPFSRTEFERRLPVRTFGVDLFVASAEDTVLAKLEWSAIGGSDRQVADAAKVLSIRGDELDHAYLDRWAAELGVTDLLAQARQS